MQFKIRIDGSMPDVGAIEQTIRTIDPSALVDIDPTGKTMRVAASMDAVPLLELIRQAGYSVVHGQLEQVPSECCGGCGG